jgi:hypothetical protein
MLKHYAKKQINYRKLPNWHLGVLKICNRYRKSGGNGQNELFHHAY